MGHFIERFRKVQQDGVDLLVVVQDIGKVLDSINQLRLTGYSFPETMLLVREYLFLIQELHDMAMDDVFHDLDGDWS